MHKAIAILILASLVGCGIGVSTNAANRYDPKSDETSVVIAESNEPGEKLIFSGRVLDYRGQPLAKAAVMAYHADRNGLYNPRNSPTRTPRIRNVAITDQAGRFRFVTIRPGPYPDRSEPAHIHVGVMAPAHRIREFSYWFQDDPLMTPTRREQAERDPEVVIVNPERQPDSSWTFHHDIRLEGN